jgi:6,7-dimethyl-8-ribityllumazine synthase
MSKKKTSLRAAVLAATFNEAIVDRMLAAVKAEAEAADVEISCVIRVPGAYELPLAADRMLARIDCDFVVILGYIERGETQHGEVMGQVVHHSLIRSSLKYETPLGLGIIGPGATLEQADQRAEAYGRAALVAALAALRAGEEIRTASK